MPPPQYFYYKVFFSSSRSLSPPSFFFFGSGCSFLLAGSHLTAARKRNAKHSQEQLLTSGQRSPPRHQHGLESPGPAQPLGPGSSCCLPSLPPSLHRTKTSSPLKAAGAAREWRAGTKPSDLRTGHFFLLFSSPPFFSTRFSVLEGFFRVGCF